MTSNHPTPATAALVAVDVAKLRNEVLIEISDAWRRRRMTVTNTRAEHDRLIAELHALERPVTIGLEPTGHYHRPLAWRLVEAGFDVRLISSVALARTREALHNGWDKTIPRTLRSSCTCCGSVPPSPITIRWPTGSTTSRNCR
jgi:hypothetical protein